MALKGKDILVYLTIKYQGDWNQIYQAIKNKELVDEVTVSETLNKCEEKYVTIIDDNYPEKLKKIYKPPFVLFYKGDLNLINGTNVSIAGSDDSSVYTYELLNKVLKKTLSKYKEITIASLVSGAYDSEIYSIYGKNRILVFNRGIQQFDKNADLIVSEYPSESSNKKDHTPWAYRILVGISNALLIPEVKRKEDTLIAAGYGLYLGKPLGVFAQQEVKTDGTTQLAKDGALLISTAEELAKLTQVTPQTSGNIPSEMQ
jgi:DNA processing protein